MLYFSVYVILCGVTHYLLTPQNLSEKQLGSIERERERITPKNKEIQKRSMASRTPGQAQLDVVTMDIDDLFPNSSGKYTLFFSLMSY